jgi:hypothetical protein
MNRNAQAWGGVRHPHDQVLSDYNWWKKNEKRIRKAYAGKWVGVSDGYGYVGASPGDVREQAAREKALLSMVRYIRFESPVKFRLECQGAHSRRQATS